MTPDVLLDFKAPDGSPDRELQTPTEEVGVAISIVPMLTKKDRKSYSSPLFGFPTYGDRGTTPRSTN